MHLYTCIYTYSTSPRPRQRASIYTHTCIYTHRCINTRQMYLRTYIYVYTHIQLAQGLVSVPLQIGIQLYVAAAEQPSLADVNPPSSSPLFCYLHPLLFPFFFWTVCIQGCIRHEI